MKVIFSGGGTLGPVTPLLAIYEVVKKAHPETKFLWVGTKSGPEKQLIEQQGISFQTLASGKFRRYLSIWNLVDIFRIGIGFFQSFKLLWIEKPDICISAGGFISVPLHIMAWIFGIPTWIHQQDVDVGLANRLMAPYAKKITTALEMNVKHFSKRKTEWLGNPVREDVLRGDKEEARIKFNLKSDLPILFATGGGTGSLQVNQLIVEASNQLEHIVQIVHLTGRDRPQELSTRAALQFENYHVFKFFTTEMKHAYAVADVVVSRGGFGTLSELAALGKPAILIPKGGHQEENVQFLADAGAAIVVSESSSNGLHLAGIIKELLQDEVRMRAMGKRLGEVLPRADNERVLEILRKLLES